MSVSKKKKTENENGVHALSESALTTPNLDKQFTPYSKSSFTLLF